MGEKVRSTDGRLELDFHTLVCALKRCQTARQPLLCKSGRTPYQKLVMDALIEQVQCGVRHHIKGLSN